jgi:Leucine-rich repeat (LRR) protein
LQKNQFRTITGLYKVLDDVMFNAGNLLWLDLSYNYLERIEDEIVNNFKQLRTLYFHGNYVLNLEEVRKLGQLENLHTLTLYGNQIE